jgi:hypothetical protein
VKISHLSTLLTWIGSFYLAAFAYFVLIILLIDILRLLNLFFKVFPSLIYSSKRIDEITALVIVAVVFLMILFGYINARNPRIKRLEISIQKKPPLKSLTVAMASDIHLGTIICKRKIERIVKRINMINPDIVLLPGDVVDEDLAPVIKQNLGETLKKITSKYGLYAVTGNHEYIGGVEPAVKYLTEHGINVLRDSYVKINNSFYVVGREDISIKQFAREKRKPLNEIMTGIDKNLPVILMDHQPFHLNEAVEKGVDLQLSGHTHHGQLWPFNFITKKVYEISWGYKLKGGTHFYVSCGAGTWGPPIRIGNTPEIMCIKINFI